MALSEDGKTLLAQIDSFIACTDGRAVDPDTAEEAAALLERAADVLADYGGMLAAPPADSGSWSLDAEGIGRITCTVSPGEDGLVIASNPSTERSESALERIRNGYPVQTELDACGLEMPPAHCDIRVDTVGGDTDWESLPAVAALAIAIADGQAPAVVGVASAREARSAMWGERRDGHEAYLALAPQMDSLRDVAAETARKVTDEKVLVTVGNGRLEGRANISLPSSEHDIWRELWRTDVYSPLMREVHVSSLKWAEADIDLKPFYSTDSGNGIEDVFALNALAAMTAGWRDHGAREIADAAEWIDVTQGEKTLTALLNVTEAADEIPLRDLRELEALGKMLGQDYAGMVARLETEKLRKMGPDPALQDLFHYRATYCGGLDAQPLWTSVNRPGSIESIADAVNMCWRMHLAGESEFLEKELSTAEVAFIMTAEPTDIRKKYGTCGFLTREKDGWTVIDADIGDAAAAVETYTSKKAAVAWLMDAGIDPTELKEYDLAAAEAARVHEETVAESECRAFSTEDEGYGNGLSL